MNRVSLDGGGRLVGSLRSVAAPVLALVGLVIVAIGTAALFGGSVNVAGPSSQGPIGPAPNVVRTPAPSNVVIAEPQPTLPGALVYAKAGNIWVQRGESVVQITTSGTASMPAWTPDGQSVVYIETTAEEGLFPAQGRDRRYRMDVPRLMRIRVDGSAAPELLADGGFSDGRYRWHYWLRQPTVSPDGRTVALVSDAPNPTRNDVVLQLLDVATGGLRKPDLPQTAPLGHQDPAWRPDGGAIVYTRNERDGARGAPTLMRFMLDTGRAVRIAGPGYSSADYSPDGRHIAATKTDTLGTDVVILDASTGTELARLSDDDRSWAPVWSPRGDAVAFLHIESGIVDLRMVELTGSAPAWTIGEAVQLTHVSGLDAASRPDWFIPPEQMPPPTRPPGSPAASPSGSGSPGSASASAAVSPPSASASAPASPGVSAPGSAPAASPSSATVSPSPAPPSTSPR